MQARDRADDLAIHLFRPWVIDVARAQAGLDMVNRNLAVIGGQSARHGGGGVALHHHAIGLLLVHHPAQIGDERGGQRIEALIRAHQVKIVIGGDPGDLQHLIQHAPVLCRHANPCVKTRVRLQRGHHREQLDRLGTGAENHENTG